MGGRPYSRFTARKGGSFTTEKILGGELALYLLRLVAVSVPVEQVGVGGTFGGQKEERRDQGWVI